MEKKKHVLFIVENACVPADSRVWGEARALKEFGYDVTVICPRSEKWPAAKETLEGITIYRHYFPIEAEGKFGFALEYLNALFWEGLLSARIFFGNRFHIIHGANPPDLIFIVGLLFKVFGVKYVFDHHDITPETYIAKFGLKDIVYKMLSWMEKATFNVAEMVISTNESYKTIALGRGGKKEEEVFVVRNGPDLSKIYNVQANPRLKDGFDYLVAYLGVINSQEGIDNLLRAVRYIVREKRIRNAKFVIVGKGPEWRKMVKLSRELHLSKYVTFTGYIPYRDLYEVLATADICVNPEFRNEFTDKSTMIKIMDYMTFGKPTVMFETTEGKVTAGDSAYYVKSNDEREFAEAIVELLKDRSRREEMGRIAKRRIEELWQWEIQKKELYKAYSYLGSKRIANL